jgi:hypothetical protein
MDPQKETSKPPSPIDPSELSKTMYPNPTAISTPGPIPPAQIKEARSDKNQSPLGLVFLALLYMAFAGYGLWNESQAPDHTPLNYVIGVFSLLMGVGLFFRKNVVRIIVIAVSSIEVIFESLALLILKSTSAPARAAIPGYSTNVLILLVILLAFNIFLVFYLTRPAVKDLFR